MRSPLYSSGKNTKLFTSSKTLPEYSSVGYHSILQLTEWYACFMHVVFSGQVRLAEMLEQEGADIIQTEGGTSSSPLNPGVHGLIEKVMQAIVYVLEV